MRMKWSIELSLGPIVPRYVGLALEVEEKKSLVLLLATIDAGDEVRPL
jgi:hypothetical protein